MDVVLQEANQKVLAALSHLNTELASIRGGRANPTLIENILVDVYGSKMKLVEIGTISTPQSSLLIVQVWDASIVAEVVKALQESKLGLNPSCEGQLIRLPIPPLTEERRQEFIKLVSQKIEDSRIKLRQIRQDTKEAWEYQMEGGEFGEDEYNRRLKLLQDLVNKTQDTIDVIGQAKKVELTQI